MIWVVVGLAVFVYGVYQFFAVIAGFIVAVRQANRELKAERNAANGNVDGSLTQPH